MTQLASTSTLAAWLAPIVILGACQSEPAADYIQPAAQDAGPGADAGAAAPFDAGVGVGPDVADAAEPWVDTGSAVDAGGVVDPEADAGGVVDPVVDSGTVTDPVEDAGAGVDSAVDSGGATDPPSDSGTTVEPRGLTLYYIRHAEVVGNTLDPENITLESLEEFSALGAQQVDALTNYLLQMDVVPDAVLVSPTWRTQKTIEPYLVATGLTGEIWMELNECPDSEPTGGPLPTAPTFIEFYEASIEANNMVFRDPEATQYWDNQTYEDGLFMAMTARDELLGRYSQTGLTLFVSGHAVAGNILLGLLRGYDMSGGIDYTSGDMVWMQNTGIQLLVQDPATGAFSLEGSNLNDPVIE